MTNEFGRRAIVTVFPYFSEPCFSYFSCQRNVTLEHSQEPHDGCRHNGLGKVSFNKIGEGDWSNVMPGVGHRYILRHVFANIIIFYLPDWRP